MSLLTMAAQSSRKALADNRVFPIVIETPFAVGDVYSYLIKDEKIVLVDCGHYSEDAFIQLQSALNEQGIKPADIDEIWLTHGHPDHFGQAAHLAGISDAVVKGHCKERVNFAGNSDRHLFRQFFEQHDIPPARINSMVQQLDRLQRYQEPVEPEWISEDNVLSSGNLTFRVKHTPGHAPGHVVFYNDEGMIFGGDVLLDHISTNALINFDPETGLRNKSLLQYRRSLEWMRQLNGRVLPGHGKAIDNIRQVAESHLSAQQERYMQILNLLRKKPYTLFELCRRLFPDALQRGEHFLVISEVLGYLDWGLDEEVVAQEKSDKGAIFRVVK